MTLETAKQRRYLINKGVGNMKYVGIGHVRGYAGLVHTSLAISEYIPKCTLYVEPFAGLGRTAKHIKSDTMILNDKSNYAFNYLYNHFKSAIILDFDFEKIIKIFNFPETVFLIDPPWSKDEYEKGCRNRAFCDRTPKEYYDKIFELLPNLKGHWFLCGNKKNSRLKDERYFHQLFKSKRKIMGGNISTLVMSNKPFIRYHQTSLF